MNRITSRIAIALLTFVVGVAAVSLWVFFRVKEEKKNEPKQIQQSVVKQDDEKSQEEIPKVKWLYISNPIEWSKCAWAKCAYGYITVFYENGDWARVQVSITKEEETKNKFQLTFSSGEYGTELGRWEQSSEDAIKITIEKCKCLWCEATYDPVHDFNGQDVKNPFPLVEIWKVKEQIIKHQKLTTLESPIEKNRLLKRDELLLQEDLESVITARYVVWKNYNNLGGEPCSKFQTYKNRFNTENK